MTEAHTYQLSTAENELGVVIAHSEEGNPRNKVILLLLLLLLLLLELLLELELELSHIWGIIS